MMPHRRLSFRSPTLKVGVRCLLGFRACVHAKLMIKPGTAEGPSIPSCMETSAQKSDNRALWLLKYGACFKPAQSSEPRLNLRGLGVHLLHGAAAGLANQRVREWLLSAVAGRFICLRSVSIAFLVVELVSMLSAVHCSQQEASILGVSGSPAERLSERSRTSGSKRVFQNCHFQNCALRRVLRNMNFENKSRPDCGVGDAML